MVNGNQNILATVISETNIYHLSITIVNNVLNMYGSNVIIITTLNNCVHLLNGKRGNLNENTKFILLKIV